MILYQNLLLNSLYIDQFKFHHSILLNVIYRNYFYLIQSLINPLNFHLLKYLNHVINYYSFI